MVARVKMWSQENWMGLALAIAVGALAMGLAWIERRILGSEPIEGLVLAILVGMVVRSTWKMPRQAMPGVRFAAKPLMELAVVLLGASINGVALVQAGAKMAGAVVLLVIGSITVGIILGKAFGLPAKLATLVACGNSICGNSAIVTIAPTIDAEEEHVAASIAFTAILGIAVVIILPFLIPLLKFNSMQYGILAGLTVYAVPQVLAAASSGGAVAVQFGTLVKLTRVLMLGPVVFFFALRQKRSASAAGVVAENASHTSWKKFIPPFVVGFALLGIARTVGLISMPMVGILHEIANILTIAAMAGLGLLADIRTVKNAGRPVLMTAVILILIMGTGAVILIHSLHL